MAEALAESGKDPLLEADNTCSCRSARSYWLRCRHVILSYEYLMLVDEPNWDEYASQFEESGFEIYVTRGLVDVNYDESRDGSRDLKAKLNTREALDQTQTRIFELIVPSFATLGQPHLTNELGGAGQTYANLSDYRL